MFRDRADAARRLAAALQGRELRAPLVLGIPRGGVVLGAVLARELGAELDVVLARKLRSPDNPEVAVGAVSETGEVYLNHYAEENWEAWQDHLAREIQHQQAEIARYRELFRAIRPQVPVAGRSVILTDDGIATGSTMLAAIHVLRAQSPHELILAVPVAVPDALQAIGLQCDHVVCLHAPEHFLAIGYFYQDFAQVSDEEVLELLRGVSPRDNDLEITTQATSP